MGPTEVLATDRYRGWKLTCTQQPNLTVVWSVWVKRLADCWAEWDLVESGSRRLSTTLASQDEVVQFLADVLEDLRSRV